MPSRSKPQNRSALFNISAGNWNGEFINAGRVSYGLMDQPGLPREVVEFSYLIAPVFLKTPDGKDSGGVAIITTEPKVEPVSDPGWMFSNGNTPGVTVSINVNRSQFSDIVRHLESERLKEFSFVLAAENKQWRISSWNISVPLRDQ